jgi:hypothetical protein
VTNAGSNSKFLGVLDFDVRGGKVQDFRYKLLPVFSNLLPADKEMQAFIDKVRAPYKEKLEEKLAVTEGPAVPPRQLQRLLGPGDLRCADGGQGRRHAFSPGVRWGTSLLPGDTITYERMMDQMALTYPATTLNEFTGAQIKTILEDVADNIFNPDPYFQQGGDMVRIGGMQYRSAPNAAWAGKRINNMTLKGKPIEADKKYKVAGWASVQEGGCAARPAAPGPRWRAGLRAPPPAIDHGVGGLRAGAQQQAGHRVVHRAAGKAQRAQVEQREVGAHAHGQVADVAAAQHLRAAARGDVQRVARGHFAGPRSQPKKVLPLRRFRAVQHGPRAPAAAPAAPRSQHVAAVVAGAAVHAQAHRHAGVEHAADRRDAAEPGACCCRGSAPRRCGGGERAMPSSSSFTQCACHTSSPSQPSSCAYCAGVS